MLAILWSGRGNRAASTTFATSTNCFTDEGAGNPSSHHASCAYHPNSRPRNRRGHRRDHRYHHHRDRDPANHLTDHAGYHIAAVGPLPGCCARSELGWAVATRGRYRIWPDPAYSQFVSTTRGYRRDWASVLASVTNGRLREICREGESEQECDRERRHADGRRSADMAQPSRSSPQPPFQGWGQPMARLDALRPSVTRDTSSVSGRAETGRP
jgi:hypothetical protein